MRTFGHKNLIARKKHRCTWCGEMIKAGEVYHRYAFSDDNSEFGTCEMHKECNEPDGHIDWADREYAFEAGEFYRGSSISKNEMNRAEYEQQLAGVN